MRIVVRHEPAVNWGRIFDPILIGKWTPACIWTDEADTNSVVDFNISKLSGFTITAGDEYNGCIEYPLVLVFCYDRKYISCCIIEIKQGFMAFVT